jgi:hypothetical protein
MSEIILVGSGSPALRKLRASSKRDHVYATLNV